MIAKTDSERCRYNEGLRCLRRATVGGYCRGHAPKQHPVTVEPCMACFDGIGFDIDCQRCNGTGRIAVTKSRRRKRG